MFGQYSAYILLQNLYVKGHSYMIFNIWRVFNRILIQSSLIELSSVVKTNWKKLMNSLCPKGQNIPLK